MVREIITLQFGELSNYVATHFWNTQVRKHTQNIHHGGGGAHTRRRPQPHLAPHVLNISQLT